MCACVLEKEGGGVSTSSCVKKFSRHADVNKSDVEASYTSLGFLYNANKGVRVQIIESSIYITLCQLKSAQATVEIRLIQTHPETHLMISRASSLPLSPPLWANIVREMVA